MSPKPSWTSAERLVLKLIKEQEKAFIKRCLETYYSRLFWVGHSTTGWQIELFKQYNRENPNRGAKLLTIGRAACFIKHDAHWGMTSPQKIAFITKLYGYYWPIVREKAKVKKPLNPNNKTDLLQEALHRGFEYLELGIKTPLRCKSFPFLAWPKVIKKEEIGTINKKFNL